MSDGATCAAQKGATKCLSPIGSTWIVYLPATPDVLLLRGSTSQEQNSDLAELPPQASGWE